MFVFDVLLLVLLLDSVLFCLVFENFDDEDLVWLYDGLQEHLVIDELLSALLPVLLFENVGIDVHEGADLIGPDVGTIVIGWQQDAHKLVETSGLLVVNYYQELVLVSILLLGKWTFKNSVVLAHGRTRLQIFALDGCLGLDGELEVLGHLQLALSESVGQSVSFVEKNVGVGRASDHIFGLG